MQQRFGSDISRDEREREQKLRDMSSQHGVTYTAPGEKYPTATFSSYNPPAEVRSTPKRSDDDELDAMLNGLDAPSSFPAKSSTTSSSAKQLSSSDQAELDAMLGGLDAVVPVSQPARAAAPVAAPKAAASAPAAKSSKKDDAELDDLLGELGDITFGM